MGSVGLHMNGILSLSFLMDISYSKSLYRFEIRWWPSSNLASALRIPSHLPRRLPCGDSSCCTSPWLVVLIDIAVLPRSRTAGLLSLFGLMPLQKEMGYSFFEQ